MKIVPHQAERVDLPAGLRARLAEGGEETALILLILENRFLPIPAIHHVIDRPWIFDSQFVRHACILPKAGD